MSMLYAVVVLLAVVFTGNVDGFGSGAPSQACTSMTPGHKSQGSPLSPQSSTSPYSLSVSASSYSPSTSSATTTLAVSVNGAGFQGVLMQARKPGQTTPIGTFTNPPVYTKLSQCTSPGDSMTHSVQTQKSDGTSFTWVPPAPGVGDIEFVVTVAQNHDTYWIGIKSDVITEAPVIEATTSQQTTGNETITGTAPTAASGLVPTVSDGIPTGRISCLIIIFNIVMVALFM